METEKLEASHTVAAEPNSAPAMPSSEATVETKSGSPRSRKGVAILLVGIVAIILIAIAVWRGLSHATPEKTSPVTVGVVKVARADLYNEVPIPAEFRPYMEVELHPKVSGYVDQMNVDFGDHVKAGQLLATLEVPELRDQLHNAMAVQQKAEADYTNADLMFQRLTTVSQKNPELVAQQDIDDARAKKDAASAAIAAAKADVERYQTMMN
ncbi:MAG TPA: biotin/lipoyl-binding protein, partial [Verrucomicrobiae bacterium]|nr:biotin/lipoyl-binding protein [Verrucomicrobiae bacterium]